MIRIAPTATDRRTAILLGALATLACTNPAPVADAAAPPWGPEPAVADTSDGVRILVLHDMEGLVDQTDPTSFDFGTPLYPQTQALLAADVNAVIEGLFLGGATAVDVVDGHGSGNPDPDLRPDLLDTRATQLLRDEPFDAYFDTPQFGGYDGVAVVGMHAKTGSGGFASHTYTLGIGLVVNGQAITETELVGLAWGRVGVPVIFGSGDDRLAADLATMPWLEFVTVKTAVGADSAVVRPAAEARAELTARARAAVENLLAGRTSAMRPPAPLRVGVKAVPPASLALIAGLPGITVADSVATFSADSIRPAYAAAQMLIRIAGQPDFVNRLRRSVARRPGGQAQLDTVWSELSAIWFDYESGRWRPPVAAPTTVARKHHGYR